MFVTRRVPALPSSSPWLSSSLVAALAIGCASTPPPPPPERVVERPALPFAPGHADPARKAKLDAVAPALDALFEAKMKESGATGLAVGIVLEGELAYQRGFGVRDLTSRAPVDADTVFRIASMTKSFTALAVMKLRDEGRLTLDAPAERYWPALSALTPPSRDAPPISLRLLLTNAAGLAYDDLWGAVTFGKSDEQLATLLQRGVQLSTTPGTGYAYSNLGWALLGKVVERVSGRGIRAYVSEDLLRPLGMTSTAWEADEVAPERLAVGYRRGADGKYAVEPRPSDGVFAPAGGLYTSLRDYARYAAFQLQAYPPRDEAEVGPVRRSTLREMHAGQRWARNENDPAVAKNTDEGLVLSAANYGFGWLSLTSCSDAERVQHGGFEPGYFGWVGLIPRARVGFVALATSGPAPVAARVGALQILRDAGLLASPDVRPHPALEQAAAAAVRLLEGWSPALFERTFDPDSARYSWNEGLRTRFAALGREHGRCRPAAPMELHGSMQGTLRLACERGGVTFELVLAPDTPSRLQHLGVKEELALDGVAKAGAKAIAAAIGPGDERAGDGGAGGASALPLAPALDPARTVNTLRRFGLSHRACTVERSWKEVAYEVWNIETALRATLKCDGGPLDVAFSTDAQSGRITSLDVHPPRAPGAACWP